MRIENVQIAQIRRGELGWAVFDGIESFGQFDDMLGFATSLFTGLTVIGLVR